jgi:glutathione S-transferase
LSELRLSRRFEAPRERVFEAWTDPAFLRRWWAAVQGWTTAAADVDLRPGGRYRLAMRNPADGTEYAVGGEYVEVAPPERLVYTWTWEGDAAIMAGSEDTIVEVEFRDEAGSTAVVLTHRRFADDRIRDLHGEGWDGCLRNLEDALA